MVQHVILYIDDDPDDRFFMSNAIKKTDSTLILKEAESGKNAIEYLNQAKLAGDLPSLIILDINIPVMDGMAIHKEIKKDTVLSTIPIIIFTTSMHPRDINYWEKENIEMITKPPGYTELVDCIGSMLKPYIRRA